jgi:hypothetical protein
MLLTEDDWLSRPYPADLLRHVEKRATPRQLRLFARHCCRRLDHLFTSAVRQALHAAERFADQRTTVEELRAGWTAVRRALARAPLGTKWERALDAALHACSPDFAFWDAITASREAARALDGDWIDHTGQYFEPLPPEHNPPRLQECASQCVILRDLFPYVPVCLPPALFAWEGGQLVRIARGFYEEGRFAEMPVLADALEEAGCEDARLLEHARGPGPHFKGCWLLDALIGRPSAERPGLA